MCKFIKNRNKNGYPDGIDKCLIGWIQDINEKTKYKTLASCCGHGIFHPTIIITLKKTPVKFYFHGYIYEFFSNLLIIPIQKRYLTFYQKDKKTGLYFIPEVEEMWRLINETA